MDMSIFVNDENLARYRVLMSAATSDADRMALLDTLKRQYAAAGGRSKIQSRASNARDVGDSFPSQATDNASVHT